MFGENTSRRTVLGAIGSGIGSGISTRRVVGNVERTTRIVAGRAGKNGAPVYTKKVPSRWLRHQQEIRELNQVLQSQVGNRDFVEGTACVAGNKMIDGVYLSRLEINVKNNTSNAQIAQLPDSAENAGLNASRDLMITDISIRKVNGETIANNVDCNRGLPSLNNYPGGVEAQDSNSSNIGTSGFKVQHTTGHDYMITANHVLNDGSCGVADDGMDDGGSNKIGPVQAGNADNDWAAVADFNTTFADKIEYEENGTTHHVTIDGSATQNGLESIQGIEGTCSFQGIISGHQDAFVQATRNTKCDSNCCISFIGNAVRMGVPDYVRNGDSGGPYWWNTSNGDDLVIGVHSVSEGAGTFSGCGVSGTKGRPGYTYPFWRVENNTNFFVP